MNTETSPPGYDPGVLSDYFHYSLRAAAREVMHEVLRLRFGSVPDDIAAELRHCDQLSLFEQWVEAANTLATLDQIRHYIFVYAPFNIE